MDKTVLERYLDICDHARVDPEYLHLYTQYQIAQFSFMKVVKEMEPIKQDIILAYIGACSDLHLRLMELACQ